METARHVHNVRLDSLRKKHFAMLWALFIVMAVAGGLLTKFAPAPLIREKLPAQNLDFLSPNSVCNVQGQALTHCVRNGFSFHHLLTQLFSLEMVITPVQGTPAGTKTINMRFIWVGDHDDTVSNGAITAQLLDSMELIADRVISRDVVCDASGTCSPLSLFKTTSVDYAFYAFTMIALDNSDALNWIEKAEFYFVYRNFEYAAYEVSARSIFAAVAAIAAIAFYCTIRKNSLFEQRWVLVLLVALVLFHNPLYGLSYVTKGDVFNWIDSVFQATFGAILTLYWLVTFDGLRQEQPYRFVSFYLPKILFVGIFYIVGIVAYGVVQRIEATDNLFNWFEDKSVLNFITAYGIIMAVSYSVWLGYLVFKSRAEVKGFAAKQRVIYYFHIFGSMVCLISVAVTGSFGGNRYAESGDYIYFNFLFTSYVFILAYLFAPVTAAAFAGQALEDAATPPVSSKSARPQHKAVNIVPMGERYALERSSLDDEDLESTRPVQLSKTAAV